MLGVPSGTKRGREPEEEEEEEEVKVKKVTFHPQAIINSPRGPTSILIDNIETFRIEHKPRNNFGEQQIENGSSERLSDDGWYTIDDRLKSLSEIEGVLKSRIALNPEGTLEIDDDENGPIILSIQNMRKNATIITDLKEKKQITICNSSGKCIIYVLAAAGATALLAILVPAALSAAAISAGVAGGERKRKSKRKSKRRKQSKSKRRKQTKRRRR